MDAAEVQETSFTEEPADKLGAGEKPEQRNEEKEASGEVSEQESLPSSSSVDRQIAGPEGDSVPKEESEVDPSSPEAPQSSATGGTSIVPNVTVAAGERCVTIKWSATESNADSYDVELFEGAEQYPCDQFKTKDSSIATHTFIDLKSKTNYSCKLYPISNEHKGKPITSETVKTEPKRPFQLEKEVNFGQATDILYELTSDDEVLLSWKHPDIGPNFKILLYDVRLVKNTLITTEKPLIATKLNPNSRQVSAQGISNGSTYTFTVITMLQNLDTHKRISVTVAFTFTKKISPTTIKDCVCKDGIITFSWGAVKGATKYEFQIMDQNQQIDLVKKKTTTVSENNNGCSIELQSDDKLRVGRYCVTRVTACVGNEKSPPNSRIHLIGGKKVVKNVTANLNKKDPYRSVDIVFDRPEEEAAEHQYKVVAISSDGRKRMEIVNSTQFTFQYLKKGFSYHFEVFAKWGDKWSDGSRSKAITTQGKVDSPLLNVGHLSNGDINLQGSQVQGNTKLNVYMNAETGQIRNLSYTLKKKHEKDEITLTWDAPDFGVNTSDYKVELYRVEIFKNNTKIHCADIKKSKYPTNLKWGEMHEISKSEFSTNLEWGEMHEISVCTLYECIDLSEYVMSNASKLKIPATPCRPEFLNNTTSGDELQLEWNSVKGAEYYSLEIHVDKLRIDKDFKVDCTNYSRKFNEILGYGKTYHAIIKAFGASGQACNESETKPVLIGGQYAPTSVVATSEGVEDPSSQVMLNWNCPEVKPNNYNVEAWTAKSNPKIVMQNCRFTKCLISGLKTGTEYHFKTIAKHANHGYTCGSFSNKIETNPAPTQIKNVKLYHGDNKATSIEVHWDKVDNGEGVEDIYYIVKLTKTHGKSETREVGVPSSPFVFKHLEACTSYDVTVTAGNKHGSGRSSEKISLATEVGTPKDVKLSPDPTMPNSRLALSFSHAEGNNLHYLATLYKCQDGTDIKVIGKRIDEELFTFENLECNTEYFVKVHVEVNVGTIVESTWSNKTKTAPNKPDIKVIQCLGPQNILIEWTSDSGCDSHEVSISCKDQIECRLIVYDERLSYFSLNEGVRYYVKVRSKNSSGYFGEASVQSFIDLKPRKLNGSLAKLKEDNFIITCHRPKQTDYRCFMDVFCGAMKVTKQPEVGKVRKAESSQKMMKTDPQRHIKENDLNLTKEKTQQTEIKTDLIEWTYNPKYNACEYTFQLWAESNNNAVGEKAMTTPIISRPMKAEMVDVQHVSSSPSTDIEISWEEQQRCNSYEIKIQVKEQRVAEAVLKVCGDTSLYKCLSPGNTYSVSVRAICQSTHGKWSEKQSITLAPAKVKFKENSTLDDIEIVNSLKVEWMSLAIAPKYYMVQLYCDGEKVGNAVEKDPTEKLQHTFKEDLKYGSLCYCTVRAFNGEQYGKPAKSKKYRIEWAKPEFFTVLHDENNPTTTALIRWTRPKGVTVYRLEIEHHQKDDIRILELPPSETKYNFCNAVPGNSYTMRLFCGCDGRYSQWFSKDSITMKPSPPANVKVTANSNVKGLNIEIMDIVTIKKNYDVCITSEMHPKFKCLKTISGNKMSSENLVPGTKYEISVITVIEKMRSEPAVSTCFTFPGKVEGLQSIVTSENIEFSWDLPQIKPDKYLVQWKVDSESLVEESLQEPPFRICRYKPSQVYTVRVMSVNAAGCGPMTLWETCTTDPLPPTDVRVNKDEKSPTTTLMVTFKDERDLQKSYIVQAWKDFSDKEPAWQVTTKDQIAMLKNLEPGQRYLISVQTMFRGKKSEMAVLQNP